MSDSEHHGGISRRTLVKSTAIGSLALAAGGLSLPFGVRRAAAAVQNAMNAAEDKVVWGACSVNCGSRCALRLHVRDDEVDAPRDKCAHFREINGTAAAFQYLQKNYNPIASSFL